MNFKIEKTDWAKFRATYWPWFVIVPVVVGFFVFASSFNYLSQTKDFVKWLSPDETANYYSARVYATTKNLAWFEKYNLLVKDIIHPRSFRSDAGIVKPISFLGLPIIYGFFASLFGTGILPYLTPIVAALGLIFFYLLIKNIFGRANAFISTLLASVFPVYIYFSARSMFHNILFLVALIIGLYCATKMTKVYSDSNKYFKRHGFGWLMSFLAGLFIGVALAVRTSELLWLGPLIIFLWLVNIKRLGIARPLVFVYAIFVALLPTMYWNNILYGSFFASGYPELNSSVFSLTKDSSALASGLVSGKFNEFKELLLSIKRTVFHFGFNLGQSYKMFRAYVVKMFPWLTYATAVGIIFFLVYFKDYKKKRWLFLLGWLGLSAVLIVYYGSWVFYDNPDPTSFTIGNSYTRYWLPIYFGALPFVSLALIRLTSFLKQPVAVWSLRMVAVIAVAVLSLRFVWFDPAEGLAVSIQKQQTAQVELNKVLKLTPQGSIIITRYGDKLLFPDRQVIIGLFDDKNMVVEYAKLARQVPLYYYNFSFKPADIDYLNNGLLKERGIRLKLIDKITDKFSLYRLSPVVQSLENANKK